MPTDLMVDRDVLALAEVLADRAAGSIQISQLSDFSGDEEASASCHRRGLQMFGQGNNVRLYPTITFDHFNLWDYSEPSKDATLGTYEEKLRKLADPARRPALIAEELISAPLGVVGPPAQFIVRG